jgi:hypothetical protein
MIMEEVRPPFINPHHIEDRLALSVAAVNACKPTTETAIKKKIDWLRSSDIIFGTAAHWSAGVDRLAPALSADAQQE